MKILPFSILLLFFSSIFGQNIQFNKSYDFSYNDNIYDFACCPDGGFILAGSTKTVGDITNILVFKTDNFGELSWNKIYGGDSVCHAYKIIPAIDGNYYLAGSYGPQVYIMKISPAGDSLSSFKIPNEYGSTCKDIVELDNTDLLLLREVFLLPANSDILRVTAFGNEVWTVNAAVNESQTIHLTTDDCFYIAGFNGMVMYPHYILSKYELDGTELFTETYSSFDGVNLCSVLSQSGEIYMGGQFDAGYLFSPLLIKTDAQGIMQWDQQFFAGLNGAITAMTFMEPGALISAGETDDQAFLLKTNSMGDSIGSVIFGTWNQEYFRAIEIVGEDLLVAGDHFNWGEGRDAWFVRIKADTLTTSVNHQVISAMKELSFKPNPATNQTQIIYPSELDNSRGILIITDFTGRYMHKTEGTLKQLEVIDTREFKAGVYLVNFKVDKGKPITGKLMVKDIKY